MKQGNWVFLFLRTDKNKHEFIQGICRYRPSAGDSKKNNYVIQVKHFETGTTEDILHWHITPQFFSGNRL